VRENELVDAEEFAELALKLTPENRGKLKSCLDAMVKGDTQTVATMMAAARKSAENKLRRKLSKQGYQLRKSRAAFSGDNFGEYMIVGANTNAVVAGARFDMTLDDVEEFANEEGV
jgi:N-dimethylarginine dimethylaminohydrolase